MQCRKSGVLYRALICYLKDGAVQLTIKIYRRMIFSCMGVIWANRPLLKLQLLKVWKQGLTNRASRELKSSKSVFSLAQCLRHCILNPELDVARLSVQLPMFRSTFDYNSTEHAVKALQSTTAKVSQLFCEVEKVIRLLLVMPVSSCEAERSFSSLRRLKTYLRSTMTQQCLNSVAILHVHQSVLMSVPLNDVLRDFVSLYSQHMQTFGSLSKQ